MNVSTDQAALGEKLMAPVSNILNQHRASIAPLLGGGGTAALQSDENVRKVATFCYPLLPGLVRLAVKEPAFVSFVMNNREKVLEKLLASKEPAAG
jgi:hypothetical protein